MHPVFNEWPICGGELLITRLNCRECDTAIQGRFIAGPFAALSSDQLDFAELFIRHEGKLTRMEAELALSYPTIRNRLHEVIRALGYEPGEEDLNPLSEDERKKILSDLENGHIDYQEAMRLLQ